MQIARAQYILDNTLMGGEFRFAFRRTCDVPWKRLHEDGITEEEDRFIKAVWEEMPGWTNYSMALRRIARGEA